MSRGQSGHKCNISSQTNRFAPYVFHLHLHCYSLILRVINHLVSEILQHVGPVGSVIGDFALDTFELVHLTSNGLQKRGAARPWPAKNQEHLARSNQTVNVFQMFLIRGFLTFVIAHGKGMKLRTISVTEGIKDAEASTPLVVSPRTSTPVCLIPVPIALFRELQC